MNQNWGILVARTDVIFFVFLSADVLATTRKQNPALDSAYGQCTCLFSFHLTASAGLTQLSRQPVTPEYDFKETNFHRNDLKPQKNWLSFCRSWCLNSTDLQLKSRGVLVFFYCKLGHILGVLKPLFISVMLIINPNIEIVEILGGATCKWNLRIIYNQYD